MNMNCHGRWHPRSLKHLNTWCPIGEAAWEGLGGAGILEEVCHWGKGFQFQQLCVVSNELPLLPIFH